jgi:hypothetical protein
MKYEIIGEALGVSRLQHSSVPIGRPLVLSKGFVTLKSPRNTPHQDATGSRSEAVSVGNAAQHEL